MIVIVKKFGENWIAFRSQREADEWIEQTDEPSSFETELVELR